MYYEIRVKGHLAQDWSDWLSGLSITNVDNNETVLSGYLVDQVSLLGVLNRLHGMNLTLLALSSRPDERPVAGV